MTGCGLPGFLSGVPSRQTSGSQQRTRLTKAKDSSPPKGDRAPFFEGPDTLAGDPLASNPLDGGDPLAGDPLAGPSPLDGQREMMLDGDPLAGQAELLLGKKTMRSPCGESISFPSAFWVIGES